AVSRRCKRSSDRSMRFGCSAVRRLTMALTEHMDTSSRHSEVRAKSPSEDDDRLTLRGLRERLRMTELGIARSPARRHACAGTGKCCCPFGAGTLVSNLHNSARVERNL